MKHLNEGLIKQRGIVGSKKYELTEETITWFGHTFYRIKALKYIPSMKVKKGDLGGWIESEDNLDQKGNCWVGDEAKVYANARVFGDALVYDNAWVYGKAEVYDNARVFGDALVYDNAWVYGKAEVYDNARVFGDAKVFNNALVYDNAWVYGRAEVYDNARVFGDAEVYDSQIYDRAEVCGTAKIYSGKVNKGKIDK